VPGTGCAGVSRLKPLLQKTSQMLNQPITGSVHAFKVMQARRAALDLTSPQYLKANTVSPPTFTMHATTMAAGPGMHKKATAPPAGYLW